MSDKVVVAKIVKGQQEEDTLSINLNKGIIKFKARLLKYRDRDTRQIIYFIPAFKITGYGATEKKAKEMLDFSVEELSEHLLNLSKQKLDVELKAMGWRNVPFAHKQFSQMFVTSDGELENYNAVADEVEHLTLQV